MVSTLQHTADLPMYWTVIASYLIWSFSIPHELHVFHQTCKTKNLKKVLANVASILLQKKLSKRIFDPRISAFKSLLLKSGIKGFSLIRTSVLDHNTDIH